MKKLFVENIRTGMTEGSAVCGKIGGWPVTELLTRNVKDGSVRYYSVVTKSGHVYFYESAVSLFDAFTDADLQDISFRRALAANETASFDTAADLYDELENKTSCSREQAIVWRFLFWYTQADADEVEKFRKRNVGKCLNDVRVPSCPAEEAYWAWRGEEATRAGTAES